MNRLSGIIIIVFSLLFFSACTEVKYHSNVQNTQTPVNDQSNEEAEEEEEANELSAPDDASERSGSAPVVPETIVDGVILQEWYEFEYPDDFRSFMDSCIEYSRNEDTDALSDLCGYGGSDQDVVKEIKQYCLDGIGIPQFRKYERWTYGGGPGRDLWRYSFWYEGYRCVLYFPDGENTHYEWMEFWLVPDDGKGYASFFYPGNKYRSDEMDFLVIDCKEGIFDGEFTGRMISPDYDVHMQGTLKNGLLDGECILSDTTIRYENGRMMETWKTEDHSMYTDVDGYYLNLPEHFWTAGHRRCIYEETDRGMVWDPF